jgi:anti-anti-sigma factor
MTEKESILDLTLGIDWDGTAGVTCRGRILHGATARRFRARVGQSIALHRRVVLDLSDVTHMDARGLGMLAALIRRAKRRNRQLVLATTAERIRYLLRLTRLDTQTECMPSEEIRSFSETGTFASCVYAVGGGNQEGTG